MAQTTKFFVTLLLLSLTNAFFASTDNRQKSMPVGQTTDLVSMMSCLQSMHPHKKLVFFFTKVHKFHEGPPAITEFNAQTMELAGLFRPSTHAKEYPYYSMKKKEHIF